MGGRQEVSHFRDEPPIYPFGWHLKRFFEDLPEAVVSYSVAIGAVAFAGILLRAAVNIIFGI
jgi:hypothetical protein